MVNTYLLVAAGLAGLVGIVHGILGEAMIFSTLRSKGTTLSIPPSIAMPPLKVRHIRILWATWHIASVFGLACAGILYDAAYSAQLNRVVIHAVAGAMCGSGLLVLFATQGRHPGWLGLVAVAVLCWLAILEH